MNQKPITKISIVLKNYQITQIIGSDLG